MTIGRNHDEPKPTWRNPSIGLAGIETRDDPVTKDLIAAKMRGAGVTHKMIDEAAQVHDIRDGRKDAPVQKRRRLLGKLSLRKAN